MTIAFSDLARFQSSRATNPLQRLPVFVDAGELASVLLTDEREIGTGGRADLPGVLEDAARLGSLVVALNDQIPLRLPGYRLYRCGCGSGRISLEVGVHRMWIVVLSSRRHDSQPDEDQKDRDHESAEYGPHQTLTPHRTIIPVLAAPHNSLARSAGPERRREGAVGRIGTALPSGAHNEHDPPALLSTSVRPSGCPGLRRLRSGCARAHGEEAPARSGRGLGPAAGGRAHSGARGALDRQVEGG